MVAFNTKRPVGYGKEVSLRREYMIQNTNQEYIMNYFSVAYR